MKNSSLAILLLRWGFAAVFAWFGVSQITDPAVWTGLIPAWLVGITGISAQSVVLANGAGDLALAALLTLGWHTPIVAAIASAHLFIIAADLGLNDISVRDMGLAISLAALALLTWPTAAGSATEAKQT